MVGGKLARNYINGLVITMYELIPLHPRTHTCTHTHTHTLTHTHAHTHTHTHMHTHTHTHRVIDGVCSGVQIENNASFAVTVQLQECTPENSGTPIQ